MEKKDGSTIEYLIRKLSFMKDTSYEERLNVLKRHKKLIEPMINSSYLYESLKITRYSEGLLFQKNNQRRIKSFKEDIKALGYNPTVLDYYLLDIDYNESVLNIFDLKNFDEYYSMFKQSNVNGIVEYLPFDNNQLFIKDKDTNLIATHPNQALKEQLVNNDEVDFSIVYDWELDPNKLAKTKTISVNTEEEIKNAINILKQERELLLKKKRDIPRHLVVIEDNKTKKMARGIVRYDENGPEVIYNPEYDLDISYTYKKS